MIITLHWCKVTLSVEGCRYAWAHIETHKGVKEREQLWQLAFGSGKQEKYLDNGQ